MNQAPPSYRILEASASPAIALEAIHVEERSDTPSPKAPVEYVPWSSVARAVVDDGRCVTLYGTQNVWSFDATEEEIYVLKRAFLEQSYRGPFTTEGLREGAGKSGSFPYLLDDIQIFSHGVSIRKTESTEHWIPRRTIAYLKQVPNEGMLLFVCQIPGNDRQFIFRAKNSGNFVTAKNPWPWNY